MNVVFIPEVLENFEDLVITLYQKEYFSFLETSKKYVDELIDDILMTLPIRLRKPAPKYFYKYGKGMYYSVFRKSKRTQWYVFFRIYRENGELIYQVRYIGNNHVLAQYL
jgi:hypothetical protein